MNGERPIEAIREVDREMSALAALLQHFAAPRAKPRSPTPSADAKDCGTMTDSLPRPHKRHVPTREERANVLFVVKQSKPDAFSH
jgi:hypothetical protein